MSFGTEVCALVPFKTVVPTNHLQFRCLTIVAMPPTGEEVNINIAFEIMLQ